MVMLLDNLISISDSVDLDFFSKLSQYLATYKRYFLMDQFVISDLKILFTENYSQVQHCDMLSCHHLI